MRRLDRRELARRGAGIVLKMVLEDGSFHADPHPGNIIYLRDGRIGVIDFGMVGALSSAPLPGRAAAAGWSSRTRRAWPTCCWTGPVAWRWTRTGCSDISQFVDQYRGVPLKDLRIGLMLGDITQLLRSYSLTLPADLALMIKAFLTLEGMGRQLDPDFDMASAARPFLERVVLQRYAPRALLKRGRRSLLGLVDFAGELPRDLRKLVQAARRGRS